MTDALTISALSAQTSIASYANVILAMGTAESSNDLTAENPRSTATGWFQFLDDTWNDYADRDERLLRTDQEDLDTEELFTRLEREGQAIAMVMFTEDNIKGFRAKYDRDPTGAEVYIMHFRGPDGAKDVFRNAENDPDRLIKTYFGNAVMDANKDIRFNGKAFKDFTTSDFMLWADKTVPVNPVGMTAEEMQRSFSANISQRAASHQKRGVLEQTTDFAKDAADGTVNSLKRFGSTVMSDPGKAFSDLFGDMQQNWLPLLLGAVGMFALFKIVGSLFGGSAKEVTDAVTQPVQKVADAATAPVREAVDQVTGDLTQRASDFAGDIVEGFIPGSTPSVGASAQNQRG